MLPDDGSRDVDVAAGNRLAPPMPLVVVRPPLPGNDEVGTPPEDDMGTLPMPGVGVMVPLGKLGFGAAP